MKILYNKIAKYWKWKLAKQLSLCRISFSIINTFKTLLLNKIKVIKKLSEIDLKFRLKAIVE